MQICRLGSRQAPRRRTFLATLSFVALLQTAGCHLTGAAQSHQTLTEARRGFTTHLRAQGKSPDPIPQPPAGYELVRYPAPLGAFPAFVTTITSHKETRHPAIVWVAGGFDNSIGDTPWAPATPDNDQSARAFRDAGIVTMYSSLRGGNNNPGSIEGLYGEVDDVLAAARYLAARPDVDPQRVYLGGHSTGGTLALLVAESGGSFRAVFAFGPVATIDSYGPDDLPFDLNDKQEVDLRSPVYYLNAIKCPTFVMEGTGHPGNGEPLHEMANRSANPLIHFYDLPGETHFSELAPITPLIAHTIRADSGPTVHIDFGPDASAMTPINP